MIEEFKSVIFERDEMENQIISKLMALLTFHVNQESKSEVLDNFHDF